MPKRTHDGGSDRQTRCTTVFKPCRRDVFQTQSFKNAPVLNKRLLQYFSHCTEAFRKSQNAINQECIISYVLFPASRVCYMARIKDKDREKYEGMGSDDAPLYVPGSLLLYGYLCRHFSYACQSNPCEYFCGDPRATTLLHLCTSSDKENKKINFISSHLGQTLLRDLAAWGSSRQPMTNSSPLSGTFSFSTF